MIDFAEQCYEKEIAALQAERDEWRTKYFDLLNSSIRHGEEMFGLVLQGALNGAFKSPETVDAVDPHLRPEGKPTTRV